MAQMLRKTKRKETSQRLHDFLFISTPFFSAQPGVAYRETVFEPQVCLDVCLTYERIFVYEIIKKLVLYTIISGNVYD